MKTININGKDFTIDELNKLIEGTKDPMDEVYAYHKTTREEFDKLYENIPPHVKAYEKECMVVAYYNKGWVPNWEDVNEKKWYGYYKLKGESPTFVAALYSYSCAYVPTRLCLRSKEDLLDMSEKFINVIIENRLA